MYNKEEQVATRKKLDLKNWQHFIVGTFKKSDKTLEDSISNTLDRLIRISPKIKKSSKVLVFSDGNSFVPIYLASKYKCKMTIMTESKDAAKQLEADIKKYELTDNVTVVVDEYTLTSFSHDHFDMIWSIGALNQIKNLILVLKEVKRLLVPQGRLILCEPTNLESDADDEMSMHSIEDLLYGANKADLEKVYEKALTAESIAHYQNLSAAYEKGAAKLKKSLGEKPYNAAVTSLKNMGDMAEKNTLAWGFVQFQKRNE